MNPSELPGAIFIDGNPTKPTNNIHTHNTVHTLSDIIHQNGLHPQQSFTYLQRHCAKSSTYNLLSINCFYADRALQPLKKSE